MRRRGAVFLKIQCKIYCNLMKINNISEYKILIYQKMK